MPLELEDDNQSSSSKKENKRMKSSTPLLDNFGKDLTKMADEGKLENVIGREEEIERLIQVLSRKKKNNPVLVGEPGCVLPETLITIRKISSEITHKIIEQ